MAWLTEVFIWSAANGKVSKTCKETPEWIKIHCAFHPGLYLSRKTVAGSKENCFLKLSEKRSVKPAIFYDTTSMLAQRWDHKKTRQKRSSDNLILEIRVQTQGGIAFSQSMCNCNLTWFWLCNRHNYLSAFRSSRALIPNNGALTHIHSITWMSWFKVEVGDSIFVVYIKFDSSLSKLNMGSLTRKSVYIP